MEWGQARKKFLASWKRIQELCKEWEEINEASRAEATAIVNAILELEILDVPSAWAWADPRKFPHLKARIEGKVWANVEKQCTTLHAQLDLLSDVTVGMKMEVAQLQELHVSMLPRIHMPSPPEEAGSDEHAEAQQQQAAAAAAAREPPLFLITSLSSFVFRIDDLVQRYLQEFELKLGMALDLTTNRDRQALTAYLSAWTLEVYLDDEQLDLLREQIETESVLGATPR